MTAAGGPAGGHAWDWFVARWRVGAAAAVISQLADYASAFFGKLYGTTTYLPTTWQRVARGTEVSLLPGKNPA